MIDRYRRAVQDLQDAEAPDQWDEITDRAADDGAVVVLDGAGGRSPRRRVTLIAAAVASVAALVGGVWLFQDDDPSSVVAEDPPASVDSEPDKPDDAVDDAETPASVDTLPPDASLQACNAGHIVATHPPEGVVGNPQSLTIDDPRIPEAFRSEIAGIYPGDTTTTVVFVLEGTLTVPYDQAAAHPGPGPAGGSDTLYAPYDDGWIAWPSMPTDGGAPCGVTVVGVGIDEADFTQFVAGLVFEPPAN